MANTAIRFNKSEALGYAHATTGNRMACPSRIANPDYRRGFTAGWRAEA